MTPTTVSEYADEMTVPLRKAKVELANRASFHGIRSVRTVTCPRYDVPALRVESRHRAHDESVRNVTDEFGLEMVTAFATEDDGNLVGLFAPSEHVDR